ncbi:Hint domain-containing protein [Candidatus Halocynthiibacter alkanivorans]|uniref:Hint domain-containing protein n=1 Tax=Candidatus Halocynthiibacter alkanivorans TaxID=2267619 RepID=UPI000DF3C394|nr:Hint domain-containing protein [Candidatus Halocynthiibacter alkanivorans]
MALITFNGNLVAAADSANDDGSGGIHLSLDQSRDLDGDGNPYYSAGDTIVIEIDDADIADDGELEAGGSDGEVTVLSIKVNGVEQLDGTDKIKFAGGVDTFEGDAVFFVEGIKLFFLAPTSSQTFEDAEPDGGDLVLDVEERITDIDFDGDGQIDAGTAEVGQGVFNVNAANVACFANGSQIPTPAGEVAVEELKKGDLVVTRDRGACRIRLVVQRKLTFTDATSKHRPVEFKPGCLGNGLPRRTLCVSPQHRMLISASSGIGAFGGEDVLVPAKGLLGLRGVRQKHGCRQVEYFHLVFDRHEVVFSEGAATESLFPGPVAMAGLSASVQQELYDIFPGLQSRIVENTYKTEFACLGAGKAHRLLEDWQSREDSGVLAAVTLRSRPDTATDGRVL